MYSISFCLLFHYNFFLLLSLIVILLLILQLLLSSFLIISSQLFLEYHMFLIHYNITTPCSIIIVIDIAIVTMQYNFLHGFSLLLENQNKLQQDYRYNYYYYAGSLSIDYFD